MYHFVALLWNPEDPRSNALASRLKSPLQEMPTPDPSLPWECVFGSKGMVVYACRPMESALRPYVLPDESGVVLGRLFHQGTHETTSSSSAPVSERSAREIVRSAGRSLVADFWGAYVAFVRAERGRRAYVIRDCSGRIPCYRLTYQQIQIVFSDVADLRGLELPKFSINQRYLAAFIHSSELQIRECGLSEVTEVLAGECVEIRESKARQYSLWNPARICAAQTLDNFEDAAHAVRRTTQACVDAWSSVHNPILHRLSGGLDSSVVLGCLRHAPSRPSITCVNAYGENPREDERSYARMAAEACGTQLVEIPLDLGQRVLDSRLYGLPQTAKPTLPPLLAVTGVAQINTLAKQVGCDTVWTGEGGDHLFLQTNTDLSAADYISVRGLRRGLMAAIVDAAYLSRRPYISVLRKALALARSGAPWMPDTPLTRPAHFVNREALPEDMLAYASNSWTEQMHGIPKGKQWQIYFLAEVVHRRRPIRNVQFAYEHHPLLSQPLIELCLQIPTYILVQGGRDRALERYAFRDCVPTSILERRDKGDVTFTMTDTIRRSEQFLREVLLDGMLVRERIISRGSLERYLVQKDSLRLEQCRPLLACLAAEVWAWPWTNATLRAAA